MLYYRTARPGLSLALDTAVSHPDIVRAAVYSEGILITTVTAVYNAPRGCSRAGEAVTALLSTPPSSGPQVWLGDFNLHHPLWDPLATQRRDPQALELVDFADAHGFHLLNADARPTHDRGAVLDLSWASDDLWHSGNVCAEIAPEAHSGSDHQTICTKIFGGPPLPPLPQGRFRPDTTDLDLFRSSLLSSLPMCQRLTQEVEGATPETANTALDELAEGIVAALRLALQVSTKRAQKGKQGFRWWNQACTAAAVQHRAARAGDDPALSAAARKTLHNEVSAAKKAFFTALIDNSSLDGNFFKATRWVRKEQPRASPPLTDPRGIPASLPTAKIDLLRRTHLPLEREKEDIPVPGLPPDLHQWERVSQEEAKAALISSGNSAPGTDGIPPATLKLSWEVLKAQVTVLYDQSLAWGHHPTSFRQASLCVIQKPGKRDRSSPRAYRLIALLSTLGKGLERLVARRLAREALLRKIIPAGYHGALPLRSAPDLALALVNDVQRQWRIGLQASLLTFDIQGAFDSILPGRLASRLLEQLWPSHLIRWVVSFLQERTASVVFEGHYGANGPVAPALPQGSPVSPILFMLFMAPLFSREGPVQVLSRAGYADDGRILVASPCLDQNIRLLQRELQQVMDWCKENGLNLDLDKTELLHFSNRRNLHNPALPLPGGFSLSEISPTPTNRAMRWLGVMFTRKLSFQLHALHLQGKAAGAAGALRLLGGCAHGAPAAVLRQAVIACVIPVLTYAAEAWWPVPGACERTRASLTKALSKPLRNALRVALPVWRTTPIALLHHAAGIPPIDLLLDHAIRKAAIRLSRLDPAHTLRRRLAWSNPDTRIPQIAGAIPFRIERANPLRTCEPRTQIPSPASGPDRQSQARAFSTWERRQALNDLWVFSDGSKTAGGTGGGWHVRLAGREIASGSAAYGQAVEVYDAEARALRAGLQAAIAHPKAAFAKNLWACLDNEGVVNSIHRGPLLTSQGHLRKARAMLDGWKTRPLPPTAVAAAEVVRASSSARVLWVPGHSGIAGNERADALAAIGASDAPPPGSPASLAGAARWARDRLMQETAEWWRKQKQRAHVLLPPATPKVPEELGIPRRHLARLLAERSGHGNYAAYHDRFGHHGAPRECPFECGLDTAPGHFLECSRLPRPALLRWVDGTAIRRSDVLTSPAGARALSQWLATLSVGQQR